MNSAFQFSRPSRSHWNNVGVLWMWDDPCVSVFSSFSESLKQNEGDDYVTEIQSFSFLVLLGVIETEAFWSEEVAKLHVSVFSSFSESLKRRKMGLPSNFGIEFQFSRPSRSHWNLWSEYQKPWSSTVSVFSSFSESLKLKHSGRRRWRNFMFQFSRPSRSHWNFRNKTQISTLLSKFQFSRPSRSHWNRSWRNRTWRWVRHVSVFSSFSESLKRIS